MPFPCTPMSQLLSIPTATLEGLTQHQLNIMSDLVEVEVETMNDDGVYEQFDPEVWDTRMAVLGDLRIKIDEAKKRHGWT